MSQVRRFEGPELSALGAPRRPHVRRNEGAPIPTLPGVVAHTVSLTSFDGLMSSKGIAYVGRDAAVYMATVPGAGEEGRARFEDWAKSNGYSRTRYESWFRAGSGMFEIKFVCDRKGTAYVTVWASERAATPSGSNSAGISYRSVETAPCSIRTR